MYHLFANTEPKKQPIYVGNIEKIIEKREITTALALYRELTQKLDHYKLWGERAFNDIDVLKFVIQKFEISFINLFLNKTFKEKHPILNNFEVALLATQSNSGIYRHLIDDLKIKDEIIKAAFNCFGYSCDEYSHVSGWQINANPKILFQIPNAYKNQNGKNKYEVYTELAVIMNGDALRYVEGDEYKTDEITKEAIRQDITNFQWATEEQKNNKEIREYTFQISMRQGDFNLVDKKWFTKYTDPKTNELLNYKQRNTKEKKRKMNEEMNTQSYM
jgi:hypothetical protein